MKKILGVSTILICLSALCFIRLNNGGIGNSVSIAAQPSTPAATDHSSRTTACVTASPGSSEAVARDGQRFVYRAKPLPASPFARSVTLDSRETASPKNARELERTLLIKTDFKYPLLLVKETICRDMPGDAGAAVARSAMVADHIIVKLQPDATAADMDRLNRELGGQMRRVMTAPNTYIVAFPSATLDTVADMVAAYSARSGTVACAEPDYIVHTTDITPDDPNFTLLWGMPKIMAPAAWVYGQGSVGVVVAVLDTGLDYTHADIAANVWTNTLELANGLDDDQDGFVDDIRGWNYVNNTGDVTDDHSHGTHVSGTIGAVGSNGVGVVGVNWHVQIMPLKFMDASGNGSTSDAIEALQYVLLIKRRGVNVKITSNSWGGTGNSTTLSNTIAECGSEGILFLAAAGNDGVNNDLFPHYPASFSLSNLISVASTESGDGLSAFSNYGQNSVHIGAPGSGIYSTTPSGSYGYKSGTSMATPHVAGAAALLLATAPNASAMEIKDFMFSGSDAIPALSGKCSTGGRLNVLKALAMIQPTIVHSNQQFAMSGSPCTVTATISPSSLLDTNNLWLLWNTTGSTNSFSSNQLFNTSGDTCVGQIPTQPLGTTVYYWLQAASFSNLVSVAPVGAPASMYSYLVTTPLALTVGGYPSNLGTVSPDYGFATYASGSVIHASAGPATVPVGGQRYYCIGWTGVGNVPPTGSSNTLSFTLTSHSAISWQWTNQYCLTQDSTPAGIVNATTWWNAASTATTISAAASAPVGSYTYYFTGWQSGGQRLPDATNRADNPASIVISGAPVTATAVYILSTQDYDSDILPDWWEVLYFGSLDPSPAGDADGDGYYNIEEYLDGTDPRNASSMPQPPVIIHAPLADPQRTPAPWTVSATVTDNMAVSSAELFWKKESQSTWRRITMTNAGGSVYSAEIPAPGVFGESFCYRVEAVDAAGYWTEGESNRFFVAYPLATVSPTNVDVILKPGQATNFVVSIGTAGNTNYVWSATGKKAVFFDDVPPGVSNLQHTANLRNGYPVLDLWSVTTNRSYSGPCSWYCGYETAWHYEDATHCSLLLPAAIGPATELSFRQWIRTELDSDISGQAWDGGVIEVSTNGSDFAQVTPAGGYPYTVTPNPDSPFPAGTPCLAGTGGWQLVTVDLSAYAGLNVTIRFRFGADLYVTEEGWYIDDIRLSAPIGTNDWLTISSQGGTIVPPAATNFTVSLSTAGVPSGTNAVGTVTIAGNDPVTPTNKLQVTMRVRSEPTGLLVSAAQTSIHGEGLVTIVQKLADPDGEDCSIRMEYSVDAGNTWTNVSVQNATAEFGSVQSTNVGMFQLLNASTRSNQVVRTNTLQVVWDTRNSPLPVTQCTNTKVRAMIWDGMFWNAAGITSTPFLVDNLAPTTPAGLTNISHAVSTWSAATMMNASWNPSSDGVGAGVGDYIFGTSTDPAVPSFGYSALGTEVLLPVSGETTNLWFCVMASDLYGNTSGVALAGPFWIDTVPPTAAGASISLAHSEFGSYLVSSGAVPVSWSGFADNGSGVGSYYLGFTNLEGTAGGIWTTNRSISLSGASLDQTNRVYVWAADNLGNIGPAASAAMLILSPGGDWDGDGMSNKAEETAGVDSTNPGSAFHVESVASLTGNAGFTVSWSSATGRRYSVFSTNTFGQPGQWQSLSTNLPGTGGLMQYTDTNSANSCYYRISVRLEQ